MLKRKQIPSKYLEKAKEDKQLSLANERLGYSSSMFIEQFENTKLNWVVELEWKIKKWRSSQHFHQY